MGRASDEAERFHDARGDLLYRLGMAGLVLAFPTMLLIVLAAQDPMPTIVFPGISVLLVVLVLVGRFARSGFQPLVRTRDGLRVGTIDLVEVDLLWAGVSGHRHHGIVHLSFLYEGEVRRARVLADPARFDDLCDIVANIRSASLTRVREGELELPTATENELRAARLALYGQALAGAGVAFVVAVVPHAWTTALAAAFVLVALELPLRFWLAVVKLGGFIAIVTWGPGTPLLVAAIIACLAAFAALVAWRSRIGVLSDRGIRIGEDVVGWRELSLMPLGSALALPVSAPSLGSLIVEGLSAFVRGAPAAYFAERDLLAVLRVSTRHPSG